MLLIFLVLLGMSLAVHVPYVEEYYEQTIDHYRFFNKDLKKETFLQRYLYQDKWWEKPSGPIFFYTGNESPIDAFWKNTGFMFDIAPKFNALILFAEHRYYGKSIPFAEDVAFKHPYVEFLTVEQALADYALLLTDFKHKHNATGPVIAFGGSYGGMLTAYMRFKYPNIIEGGIAASAPIYLVSGHIHRDFFFADVTKDFQEAGCDSDVRKAFQTLLSLADSGTQGYAVISEKLQLCPPINDSRGYRHTLLWLRNAFTNLAMLDYPYPTEFLVKLPANPVKVACSSFLKVKSPEDAFKLIAEMYYGQSKCHNIWEEFVECADPTGCGTGPTGQAWNYQACTEMLMPSGSDNVTDMFPALSFTLQERDRYCEDTWQIRPRNNWIAVQMFGTNIASSSNLVFSNGDLDPWRRGGVLTNVSTSLVSVTVKGGAHHLDLRGSNPLDPPSVKAIRQFEVDQIQDWIEEYHSRI